MSIHQRIGRILATEYSSFIQVEAVALAGSQMTSMSDQDSDVDLYVYLNAELSLPDRGRIAEKFGHHPEVGNTFFESGDEWIDGETGIPVDVMFRQMEWIEDQIKRVLEDHQAGMGYSTCFWHNILFSQVLFDRSGRYESLRQKSDQPYPEQLRRAIINKNFPILRNTQSSYVHQLVRAVQRADEVSIQHRVTAMLASYFDVLFAINRIPHPGEKRVVQFVQTQCGKVPKRMQEQIKALISSPSAEKVNHANDLIDALEELLD